MKTFTNDTIYDLVEQLQLMVQSSDPKHGMTEEQLRSLASKAGIEIGDLVPCLSAALNKIA